MAFFTLKELVEWLGMTVFEIFTHIVFLLIFSLLLTLKAEGVLADANAWKIFSPLFICDGLNAYFCVIVFVRQCREKNYKTAAMRLVSSLSLLVCCFVCKFLLCQRQNADDSGQNTRSYGEVFAPVFVMLQVLMVRACQVN